MGAKRLKILPGKEAVKFLVPEKNSTLPKHLKGGKARKREGGKGREMPLKMFPSGAETLIFRAA